MSKRGFGITFWWYGKDGGGPPFLSWRYLGPGRRAIDIGRFSIFFEVWPQPYHEEA